MTLRVKICGLKTPQTVSAAAEGGAAYVGFVFYPPSPRAVDEETTAMLLPLLPATTLSVGLFVDPDDALLSSVLRVAPVSMLQLHGHETPQRVKQIKQQTGLPVIKAQGISCAADIDEIRKYENVADCLLLDAKPPRGSLPGGNATRFDWSLLQCTKFSTSWMLAGGLTLENMETAQRQSQTSQLDVSSGVEDSPGIKSVEKIKAFLLKAHGLETCC